MGFTCLMNSTLISYTQIWNWHLHNLIDEDFEITSNITAPRYYLNTVPPQFLPIPKQIVFFYYDVDDFSPKRKCIHWLIFSWPLDPDNQGYADISIASPSHPSRHSESKRTRNNKRKRGNFISILSQESPKQKFSCVKLKSDADDVKRRAENKTKTATPTKHIWILSKIKQTIQNHIQLYIYIYISLSLITY
jgi:hypothetical protein